MSELVDNFAHRLSYAITIRNIKPIELSRKTGISKYNISYYMNGKSEAKQDGVKILAEALNVNPVWLMGYDVPMDRNLQTTNTQTNPAIVLIYGTIPAGVPMECIEDVIDTEEIPTDMLKGGKQYFGLKIKGDSMEPDYINNDIIILEKVNDCENGEDCVVMVNR